MAIWEIVLLSLGLAMDAFAVAMCKGVALPRLKARHAVTVGLYFGGFQALMPMLGYWLGARFSVFVNSVDHWVAFIILSVIGLKMVYESLKKDESDAEDSTEQERSPLRPASMLALAVATSVDAFAVGIMFGLKGVSLALPATMIGLITFALSALGAWVGHRFGARFEKSAERVGGSVLVLLGIKMLIEHLVGG
ncbi:putative manganese efflux pump MntP [Clostridia bacterium]|nr:putative manganese efflux pump MntP [Clostridia bacterium]